METALNEIVGALQERFEAQPQAFRGQAILRVPPENLTAAAQALRDEYGFAMLSDETAVDYGLQTEPRFHVIYQFRDLTRSRLLALRVPLEGPDPRVASLAALFPNANWLEREIWDMFGIVFEGHPDLRRILMPTDWEGHPLRKDYPLGYEEVQFTFSQKEIMARKPHPKE